MSTKSTTITRSVLRHLDADALTAAARRESRARQWHLPPTSVYRWWARRTETVTGAIIDAVATDSPKGNRLLIADPFAGGGVIALAALLRGHRIYAQDVNPWAARSLATMLSLPAPPELDAAADRLHEANAHHLASAYTTTLTDGTPATVSNTLRVATGSCPRCETTLRLFPAALVSLTKRIDHGGDTGFLACPAGHVHLGTAAKRTGCVTCGRYVQPSARYTTRRIAKCAQCHWSGKLTELAGHTGFGWDVVLVERISSSRRRREIGPPTQAELTAADDANWHPKQQLPAIAVGMETTTLLGHGIRHWHQIYPDRQRAILESLLQSCTTAADGDPQVLRALEAAIIGATEMAGYLSRWDPRYLKAYEAVANHRFNFTTLAAEPNVWGAHGAGRGTVERRLAHIAKASTWLEEKIGRSLRVDGPRPSETRRTAVPAALDARIVVGGSQRLTASASSLDAVVTDPPYHDDVQYAELSNIFRAWAGGPTGSLRGDIIVNRHADGADTVAYQQLLTEVFLETLRTLRPGGHLILSYANRHPDAWVALFDALQAAGYQTAGYTVVHSENETDHAKAGRRACMLDILIDLVRREEVVEQYCPQDPPISNEEEFCHKVGSFALRIGQLSEEWAKEFTHAVRQSAFLSEHSPKDEAEGC
ncbi:MAG: hypothetical protein F4Z00_11010 [Acidimicrobiaceae bacterium]|nr:hypothetical protein [Acidimicrobiaceae bacterium]MXZ66060.1 hypothetical protein [Acidimicrobiaceae bacterium]MYF33049.1 hypothetical protein [Acidimicrobiaceae bacterium]MYG79704.1 hypothetical protein [Acidimicrobiaceae bacterium]MYJ83664.1 hypothetical protein [Acidimicrobiaceae bacterium]